MDLLVFLSSKNCPACPSARRAAEFVKEKFKSLHVDFLDLEHPATRATALQFRIPSPPAFVLNGERIFADKIPTGEELAAFIEEKQKPQTGREGRRWWSVSGLPETKFEEGQ